MDKLEYKRFKEEMFNYHLNPRELPTTYRSGSFSAY